MSRPELKLVVEAALMAAGRALSVDELVSLFDGELDPQPTRGDVREAVSALSDDWADRGLEVVEVGSGVRVQVRASYSGWITRLWAERPPRYTRALLETLALIAYRQPITRGEIEDVRGVSVSTSIIKTLTERDWVRVLGHREVPGRPALYGTTRAFLDHFGLKSLEDLPPLSDLRDLDSLHADLFDGLAVGPAPGVEIPMSADGAGDVPGEPGDAGAGSAPEPAAAEEEDVTTSSPAPPAPDAPAVGEAPGSDPTQTPAAEPDDDDASRSTG